MCGIVAVLRRSRIEPPLDRPKLIATLAAAAVRLEGAGVAIETLCEVAELLAPANAALKTVSGIRTLLLEPDLADEVDRRTAAIERHLDVLETGLDAGELVVGLEGVEAFNRAIVCVRDVVWAIRRDRLGTSRGVAGLAGGLRHEAAIRALVSVHQVLGALDRLEVRGRDSAGVFLLVRNHDIDYESPQVRGWLADRGRDPLYANGSVRVHGGAFGFVYKTAAEIGELGDNMQAVRAAISSDPLLHRALEAEGVEVVPVGHTRWASVGLINEANAHPLNEEQAPAVSGAPSVIAALNGDVDNYADLKVSEGFAFAKEITTDAKVIPVMVSSRIQRGASSADAFRDTVSSFVGSVAIIALSAEDPERLMLALRGSGQALYVGLSDDCYLVASEPYGLVEETSTYLRLDGETPADPERPSASRGQIVILDRRLAGDLAGIERRSYEGAPLPVCGGDLQQVEITTRDIDRGHYPHFFLKEISEAARSFHKTLRGKWRSNASGDAPRVDLGPDCLPSGLVEDLRAGRIRRVFVVGQGTAAVAGRGVARALEHTLRAAGAGCQVSAMPATELSGFHLEEDMSDAWVVAISQSGTTTDTNRTVDLVRSRGARVVAIVNRRHSDLTDKADGVLYTSDGRDIEMSVASTKAFYSQVAAGYLLAVAVAEQVGRRSTSDFRDLLAGLRELPAAMTQILGRSGELAAIASRFAPSRRYWAVVGNGWNRIAAEEVRIKLSELCYKSISCDVTEDKKHIDLSCEPLILVCAAGLVGSTADDVAKEIAIYRAHKATPIVIATEGDQRFAAAAAVFFVPPAHPWLSFVLAAFAGHLFGYHAALAIDAQARPLREIRSAIEKLAHLVLAAPGQIEILGSLRASIATAAAEFQRELAAGTYDGHLEASTAVRVATLLRVVEGLVPLDAYPSVGGRAASPAGVADDLTEAITAAIGQLTRPVDAIKHQAKTVTVGISRTDESLLMVPLVRELVGTGVDRGYIGYADLRTLAALDPVVERVTGYTRYALDGDPESEDCSIRVIASGGLAQDLPSRTATQPHLKGTKRRVALERRLLAARGQSDGRVFLLVPEIDRARVRGLVLLHVKLAERASTAVLRRALQGYRNRYSVLRDAVTETEPGFREDYFERLTVSDLLLDPIHRLADRWRLHLAGSSGVPPS